MIKQNETTPNMVIVEKPITNILCFDSQGNALPVEKATPDMSTDGANLYFDIKPTPVTRIEDTIKCLHDAHAHFTQILQDCKEDGVTDGIETIEEFLNNFDNTLNIFEVYKDHTEEELV